MTSVKAKRDVSVYVTATLADGRAGEEKKRHGVSHTVSHATQRRSKKAQATTGDQRSLTLRLTDASGDDNTTVFISFHGEQIAQSL
ncbi:hypothetical protein ACOMHN_049690 [Nucella lapillus]